MINQVTKEDIESEIERLQLEMEENKKNNKYENPIFNNKNKKEEIFLPVTTRKLDYKNPNLLLLNLTEQSKFDHVDNKIEKERYIYKEQLNQAKLIEELSQDKEKRLLDKKYQEILKN